MRRELFASREFRLLLAGQATNMFGDSAMILVLGIWVKQLTGSSSAAGLIFMLLAIPAPLAPLTGLLVDRLPRRRVLIGNDVLSGLLVLSLLLVRGSGDVWIIYLVALGYGLSIQVYRAARAGLVHSLLAEGLLGDANGIFSALGQGLRVAAPLLGAGLFAWVGGGAVAVLDVATFGVSAGIFAVLHRVPELPRDRGAPRPALLPELVAGARHIMRTPELRQVVLGATVAFGATGLIDVAVFAMVDQGMRRPATFIAVLGSVQGAGSVLAGLLIGRVLRRLGEVAAASAGFALCSVGLLLAGTARLPVAVPGALVAGLGLPTVLVANLTLLQRRTPGSMQGRVVAAAEAMIDIPFAISIGCGALLIGTVGFHPVYYFCAVVFGAVALAMLPSAGLTRPAQSAAPAVPAAAVPAAAVPAAAVPAAAVPAAAVPAVAVPAAAATAAAVPAVAVPACAVSAGAVPAAVPTSGCRTVGPAGVAPAASMTERSGERPARAGLARAPGGRADGELAG